MLDLNDLHPFCSYVLASKTTSTAMQSFLASTLEDARSILEERDGVTVSMPNVIKKQTKAWGAALDYRLERLPTWYAGRELKDVKHELFSIVAWKRLLAFYCSETWLKSTLIRLIKDSSNTHFSGMCLIEDAKLSAALVAGNATKTLWLSGTHPQTQVKADNKVISGTDLRYALDPLNDQTFYFTAARTRARLGTLDPLNLGVAPSKASVWASSARSWDQHRDTACAILETVNEAALDGGPVLPVLAVPAPSGLSVSDLGEPFDAAFIPPESLVDQHAISSKEALGELSQYILNVTHSGDRLVIEITGGQLEDASVRIALRLYTNDPKHVRWDAELLPPSLGDDKKEVASELLRVFEKDPDWIKVWFDSGYTLAGSSLFMVRHRDQHFSGWMWKSFDKYDVTKEKPKPFRAERFGKDDSLFCWVVNHKGHYPWSERLGWLASNDGSMEIADFIHVDPEDPALTLVHVKGANNDSDGRQVSASAYEVVVGQAIKNLRHLDHQLLGDGFLTYLSKNVKGAVWENGNFKGEAGRAPMQKAIETLGSQCKRQIVIVQPHVRKPVLDKADTSTPRNQLARKHLDTLLLQAQAACQSLGASFSVISDKGG